MPKTFKTNKRILTEDEKYNKDIFYYTYETLSLRFYRKTLIIVDQYF